LAIWGIKLFICREQQQQQQQQQQRRRQQQQQQQKNSVQLLFYVLAQQPKTSCNISMSKEMKKTNTNKQETKQTHTCQAIAIQLVEFNQACCEETKCVFVYTEYS
jgi:steroid 5-alpha reductase family enzyme